MYFPNVFFSIFHRNLSTSQVLLYYNFCEEILDEISTPIVSSLSATFFEYLLQVFYKIICKSALKDKIVVKNRAKLHLGLDFMGNAELREITKTNFVLFSEKFICGDEQFSALDYKELVCIFILFISN